MDGPPSAALDEATADDPVHAGSRTLYTDPLDACRRAGAEEVAPTVVFLASDAPDFMTGAIVDVNAASYLRFRGRPGESKLDENRACEPRRVEADASLWLHPIIPCHASTRDPRDAANEPGQTSLNRLPLLITSVRSVVAGVLDWGHANFQEHTGKVRRTPLRKEAR
jgi:hypothetical protein